jgi:hypothetical protein
MIDNAHWLELQKRLGPQGRMGIAARFFDSVGGLQDEVTFNARQLFPMASIAKIAIAMLVAARVENLELSLDDTIPIDSRLLSPGLARSPPALCAGRSINNARHETPCRNSHFAGQIPLSSGIESRTANRIMRTLSSTRCRDSVRLAFSRGERTARCC